MESLGLPIFQKSYDLYKAFYSCRDHVAKQDRHTVWQRCENLVLDLLQSIILASQQEKTEKLATLESASVQLNTLRILLRLTKDLKVIDPKKYVMLEKLIDEVGRMLGGWLKATKVTPPDLFRFRAALIPSF
ncbi:MAG: diversity-generating retroelement protein Avd [Candidatus Berkelbacteria bacterium]|nr:diversity-generating retroelement protein Avd [Candidatus Berkelbacteria bacterium]MCR4307958.1 diversity-generating retroelement protein Avd [Candidatus Berkelbacteria bacterium]